MISSFGVFCNIGLFVIIEMSEPIENEKEIEEVQLREFEKDAVSTLQKMNIKNDL